MSDRASESSTSAALLTANGRGAVAVIRVLGAIELVQSAFERYFKAANGKPLNEQSLQAIRFGHWGSDVTEEIVICRTSSESVEINCHGGAAAVDRILKDLSSSGIPTTNWFAQQAAMTSRLDAECTAAITRATTRKTALLLLQQRELWRAAADRFATADRNTHEFQTEVQQILNRAEFGRHLTVPWRVAICGRPNVGKSTLINALLGYDRAIVFDQPGTTRDVVTGETAIAGWPIVFADTAGLRETSDRLEQAGIERARTTLLNADARLIVFDQSQPLTTEDLALLEEASALPRTLCVGNKCDLEPHASWPDAVTVSAATKIGIEELCRRLIDLLIGGEIAADKLMPVSDWHIEWLQALLPASSNATND